MNRKLPLLSLIAIIIFTAAPAAKCQWIQTSGPSNPDLITVNVASIGSTLFAGTTDGVYRSTDDGANWIQVDSGVPTDYANVLVTNGMDLYLGTDAAGGLYRSTDSGASWKNLNVTNTGVNAILVSGSTIFAGTALQGFKVSTNGGTSWTTVGSFGTTAVWDFATLGSYLFAATDGYGILVSNDNGATWQTSNPGLNNVHLERLTVMGPNIFAGTSPGTNSGVYLSTNNGGNWTSVSTGLPNDYVYGLAASGTNLFAAIGAQNSANGGIYLTTNRGQSWKVENIGMTGIDSIGSPCVHVAGTKLYTGGVGVWKRPLSDFAGAGVASASRDMTPIDVYPNPTSGLVTVRYSVEGAAHVTVANLLGEIMMEPDVPSASGFTLDLSKLPAGAYFVEISSERSVVRKMVVKE